MRCEALKTGGCLNCLVLGLGSCELKKPKVKAPRRFVVLWIFLSFFSFRLSPRSFSFFFPNSPFLLISPSPRRSQKKPSTIAAESTTDSTTSSLAFDHPTSLSPLPVPTASRKHQPDPDESFKNRYSRPSNPKKKKEDQAGTDATRPYAPRISQACKSCRTRKMRCSGILKGGSCDRCYRDRLVCELDPKGSNDRAASSRKLVTSPSLSISLVASRAITHQFLFGIYSGARRSSTRVSS